MRLADVILSEKGHCLPDTELARRIQNIEGFFDGIQNMHKFVIDDICEYLRDETEDVMWSEDRAKISGPFVHPYDEFWMEGRILGIARARFGSAVGGVVYSWKVGNLTTNPTPIDLTGVPGDWNLSTVITFVQVGKIRVVPVCTFSGLYNSEWDLSPKNDHNIFNFMPVDQCDGDEDMAYCLSITALSPLLVALEWLSCKNVGTRTVDPPEKLSRKHQKKHNLPLVSYEVLDVRPIGKRKARPTGGEVNHRDLRQHKVRRHIKEYKPDAPLFGRLTGRFVWDMHVRGSEKKGVIVKDYNIKKGSS